MTQPYTPTQGRYLAFIYWYTKLHGRAPAEADMLAYFKTSSASVHQMIVALRNKGLIESQSGQARSLRILIPTDEIPDLDTGTRSPCQYSLSSAYPNVTRWIDEHEGYIEIGYDYNTSTFARALDEGGMLWGGGNRLMTLDEALQALDTAIDEQSDTWE